MVHHSFPPHDPLPPPLPALLAKALGCGPGRLAVRSWSHLDQDRLRVVLQPPTCRNWNLAFLAVGEPTVLLAELGPAFLKVVPVGELRGEAAVNLADLLLEGLEEGCARFILDFSRARTVENAALGVLQSFQAALLREGRLQDLTLLPHAAPRPPQQTLLQSATLFCCPQKS